jgi:hypothetical protein
MTLISAVEKFFPISVDGFFSDPDKIVKYAKGLQMEYDPTGGWPGKRSMPLYEINPDLNIAIISKILTCYGFVGTQKEFIIKDKKDELPEGFRPEFNQLMFQEIQRGSDRKNDVRNKGWIHRDSADVYWKPELAGLIYLNPDIDPDSGTSLFNMKEIKKREKKTLLKIEGNWNHTMRLINTQKEDMTKDEYSEFEKVYEQHEKYFIEKTRFQNIYNNMIAYDTNEYHRANNIYNNDGKDARLTLVFFIGGLIVNEYPLKRVKNREFEEKIHEHSKIKVGEKEE